MAQQFQRSVTRGANETALPHDAATVFATTTPMTPPYGECAASIIAQCSLAPGADITAVLLEIVRNPATDDVTVGIANPTFAAPSASLCICFGGVDQLPDGRDVQYALRITTTGGVDDTSVIIPFVDATLISGAKGGGGF